VSTDLSLLVAFSTSEIKRALRFVALACLTEHPRYPGLAGIRLEIVEDSPEGHFCLVATDGVRIHRAIISRLAGCVPPLVFPALWLSPDVVKAILKAPQGQKIGFYGTPENLKMIYTTKGEAVAKLQIHPDGLPLFPADAVGRVDLWRSGQLKAESTATAPVRSWYGLFSDCAEPIAEFDFAAGSIRATTRAAVLHSEIVIRGDAEGFSTAFNYRFAMDFLESLSLKDYQSVKFTHGEGYDGVTQIKAESQGLLALWVTARRK
jgi:hypothetical protein